jgi:hypothetical protein
MLVRIQGVHVQRIRLVTTVLQIVAGLDQRMRGVVQIVTWSHCILSVHLIAKNSQVWLCLSLEQIKLHASSYNKLILIHSFSFLLYLSHKNFIIHIRIA